ncbi:MAG: hypothetical protein WB919_12210 [Candidatus Sulfotelmatobacter sp.]
MVVFPTPQTPERLRIQMFTSIPIRSLAVTSLGLCLATSVFGQSATAGAATHSSVPAAAIPQPVKASAPVVKYANGKLSIAAQNATMGDLLRALSSATGAVIDFPNDHAAERMSANVGPGTVRDVLSSLLNGSGFNYVILGSQNNPNVLQRLILTEAEASTPGASTQLAPAQAAVIAPPANLPPAKSPLYVPPAASASAPVPEPPIVAMEAPKEPVAPEDLGQMMRDMAQQIRQKQQEQPQAAPPPPPQENTPPPAQ